MVDAARDIYHPTPIEADVYQAADQAWFLFVLNQNEGAESKKGWVNHNLLRLRLSANDDDQYFLYLHQQEQRPFLISQIV